MKNLKNINAPIREIQYVARIWRNKLVKPKSTVSSFVSSSLEQSVSRNFWGYVRSTFQNKPSLLPSFSLDSCKQHFFKLFSTSAPHKSFPIPSWIPSLASPSHPFNLHPPSYPKIASIIQRMKTSSSPSPLDRISMACFKRCPYLRCFLTELIKAVWSSGCVPSKWKKTCTILIHKNGDTKALARRSRHFTLERLTTIQRCRALSTRGWPNALDFHSTFIRPFTFLSSTHA